ncbi:hypothetical protein D3C87_558200 [compost metagenome]|jgi:hypothetical protein
MIFKIVWSESSWSSRPLRSAFVSQNPCRVSSLYTYLVPIEGSTASDPVKVVARLAEKKYWSLEP